MSYPVWQALFSCKASTRRGSVTAMFDIFSVHVVTLIIAGLAIVSVFTYIPFVSDFAFWFMLAAYIMLAQYRPPPKK
jgi:hypothetical protein